MLAWTLLPGLDAPEMLLAEPRISAPPECTVRVCSGPELSTRIAELPWQLLCDAPHPGRDPRWLLVLQKGLQHEPLLLEAIRNGQTVGYLPLACVKGPIFGKFLVSLPYINTAGVMAPEPAVRRQLIDRAMELADSRRVKFLQLRGETEEEHPRFGTALTEKVHMRLELPNTSEAAWDAIPSKVRNQIRKGQKHDLTVHWGREELLDEFYRVFARNMRDLGTPVFSKKLFAAMLEVFDPEAELVVLRQGEQSVAAAVLVHGAEMTEVPSASSIRDFNATNCNMLMYWHLLQRTIERGNRAFDFGRCSLDSNTYRFKKQWGAKPSPAIWHYYYPSGEQADSTRPSKYGRMIQVWQKLPVWLTCWIGPPIVRGIP